MHRSHGYARELEMLLEEKERMISILQRGVLGAPHSSQDPTQLPTPTNEWQ